MHRVFHLTGLSKLGSFYEFYPKAINPCMDFKTRPLIGSAGISYPSRSQFLDPEAVIPHAILFSFALYRRREGEEIEGRKKERKKTKEDLRKP